MNEYRIRTSGAVVTDREFRETIHPTKMLPAVLTADMLAELGADPVLPAPAPEVGPHEIAVRNGTVKDALGNWVYAWVVQAIPSDAVDAQFAANKAALIKSIDTDADRIYADVIGYRASEYLQAEQDALAYKNAGYAGTVPTGVSTWAAATGWTAQQAADDILLTAANWRAAQAQIRGTRLAKKEQAKAATNDEELGAVTVSWSSFVTNIRTQLGV